VITETFTEGPLTLTLTESEKALSLEWLGMSMAREPSTFLLPILTRALELGMQLQKPLIIDFRKLEYLNSSTITPVIRVLEQARRGTAQVKIDYDKNVKWQSLSFTALSLFRTVDSRIEIRGL
jgi:hypothetical protein